MIIHHPPSHLLLALTLLAALLMIPLSAAAERYYIINDGSEWTSADGKAVGGLTRSPGSICRDQGACYAIIFAKWGGWHSELKLPAATRNQRLVDLDPVEGQRLYQAARRGYWRLMHDER